MKNIYCISGLGADERIFGHLHIAGAHLVHLPWAPYHKGDSLSMYAAKMAALIPEEKPVILGLSFGGMIATEIAKQMPTKKVFLVSSAKTKSELGEISGLLKFLVRNDLVPYSLFSRPSKILYRQFGANTEDTQQLLNAIMRDTDTGFLGWAFKAILDWKNIVVPPNIIHIHGTDDQILRPADINADYWINHGTHMMVYDRADEVGTLIEGAL